MKPTENALRPCAPDEVLDWLERSPCGRDRLIAEKLDEYAAGRVDAELDEARETWTDNQETEHAALNDTIEELRKELAEARDALDRVRHTADDLAGAVHQFDGVIATCDDLLSLADLEIVRDRIIGARQHMEG